MNQGKYREALELCVPFCEKHPRNIQAWYVLTDLYLRTNQTTEALKAITQAEILSPEQPQILISKINCLILSGNNNLALIIAKRLYQKSPKLLAKDWHNLGIHFHQLNALNEAHSCFTEAAQIEPNNSHFSFNLATSFRNVGEIEKADEYLNKTLKLNPVDWDAYLARSLLKKVSTKYNNINDLKALLNQEKSKSNQSKLLFALAKEQEDCAQFQSSFSSLKQANDIRNEFTDYNVEHDIEAMTCIQNTFNDQSNCTPTTNVQFKSVPIFIVGLPRTGTTLLERIVSQHPTVLAAGELNNFATCLTKTTSESCAGIIRNKKEFIQQSAHIDFSKLGNDYLNSVKELTNNTSHFIDKMPLNFLYTGLIQKALPQAKIIHLTRAPMAACYAIYKTSFGQAYPFSYDLNNLGQYYLAYRKLMAHWSQCNPAKIIDVNYEQLVTSPEDTAKKVFKFLDLTWQPDYLQLNKNNQASATASSSQVRGKIYQSSVELWRNYQEELKPLTEFFIKNNIKQDSW